MVIKIGNFVLHAPRGDKIWISNTLTEEGGDFNVKEIEDLIRKHFAENF